MDPDICDLAIADVVCSRAGRDAGQLYYVMEADETYLYLVNGKDRTPEKPKRKKRKHVNKVLRPETRVAQPKRRQSAQQRITKKLGFSQPGNAK